MNWKGLKTFSPLILWAAILPQAGAWELVYVPINPSFGGNPNNGAFLLGTAQAQDKHKDPDSGTSASSTSSLEEFNSMLERSILSRVSSAVSSSVVSSNGTLIPGTLDTANFTISITDMGGGVMNISTTDKITGQTTSFQIGGQ